MAITTIDQAASGMQLPFNFVKVTGSYTAGVPYTPFYVGSAPVAASAPTPGLAGEALTSYTGQIPFTNPVSGNSYLGYLQAAYSNSTGTLMLADRLWHNSGFTITSTGAQTVNSVTFPARDANGTSNGEGVFIGVEVSGACGAATPTFSMSYTNQSGTAGRTGTGIIAGASSAIVGSFYPMGLQAGDTGVRSVQTFTLSASWISGTIHLVAYRVFARLPGPVGSTANKSTGMDWFTSGAPRLYDNTVPFFIMLPTNTTFSTLVGSVSFTQG